MSKWRHRKQISTVYGGGVGIRREGNASALIFYKDANKLSDDLKYNAMLLERILLCILLSLGTLMWCNKFFTNLTS